MKKTAILLTILICIAGGVPGQKLLILERPGTTKYYIFKTGDRLSIYDGIARRLIRGNISSINETEITLANATISLSRITKVYRPRTMLRIFSNAATIAGIGYFVLTGFNNAINKSYPLINQGTLIVSAAVTGAGVATSFLRDRQYIIGPDWRLKVIEIEHPGK